MNIKTLGRRPTLGEVLGYYTREDWLSFMLSMLEERRVVTVIPRKLHWEPNWSQDEVVADSIEDLRRHITARVRAALPDVALDEMPPYYPSFHVSVWVRGDQGSSGMQDCVFEADLPTWRDSFRDVGPIVALMDEYGVRYRQKFSGHRSLHIVIPAEAIPRGYRGRSSLKLAARLLRWSGAQAHGLPKITRMPYSLNEDTGLVCLPIERGGLAAFRPWQASTHLVEVRPTSWHESLDEADQERLGALLEALQERAARLSDRYFVPDRTRILSRYQKRVEALGESRPQGAWRLLAGLDAVPERSLIQQLASDDPELGWLAAEAFLLHGETLSRKGVDTLLDQEGEYIRVSAVDIVLRFRDLVLPDLVHILGTPSLPPTTRARTAFLLTQSEALREQVLVEIERGTDGSYDARIIAACLVGAMSGDWLGSFDLLGGVRDAEDLTDANRAQLAAIEIMRDMGGWDKQEGAQQARELASLGPAVTDLLLLAASTPFRRLRRDVWGALAELRDPHAIDMLIRALDDDYSKVRRKALQGLVGIGEPAVDALIEATASDRVRIRRYAVQCLGIIGAERAKTAVLDALGDGEEAVRRQAVRALRQLVTVDDLPRLMAFLRGATWRDATEVVEVLEALGDEAGRAVEEMALEEHNLAAAYAIALWGDDRGREILAAHLGAGGATEESAAELLRELRDPRCVPYLIEQLKTVDDWRGAFVAHELGRIGSGAAVPALVDALSSPNKHTRRGAARGLAEVKDPAAVEPLIGCLDHEDRKLRALSADALVEIGEPAVAPVRGALVEATRQHSQRRNHLRNVLGRLGVEAS